MTTPPGLDRPPIELDVPALQFLAALSTAARPTLGDVLDGIAGGDELADGSGLAGLAAALELHGWLCDDRVRADSRPELATPIAVPASQAHEVLVLDAPVFLLVRDGRFERLDHDGRLLAALDPAELHAAWVYTRPRTLVQGLEAHRTGAGPDALSETAFRALTDRLRRARILRSVDTEDPSKLPVGVQRMRAQLRLQNQMGRRLGDAADAARAVEDRRRITSTTARVPVVPLHTNWNLPPLSLGYLLAYAAAFRDGHLADHYFFDAGWVGKNRPLESVTSEPSIYLISDYLWNASANSELAERIKQLSPESVVVRGGPEVPKYPDDVEDYLGAHPYVDVVVRGEGEATTSEMLDALIGSLGSGPADLSRLHDVAGLSFRAGSNVVRTADRERIADLSSVPSPYLTGVFDPWAGAKIESALLETNRGCPYGCTFCDWGSATLSRIRKFPLDVVFEELEWCAANKVSHLALADANFGMLERDIEIAQKVADLKRETGYPTLLQTNYAKNTVRHLQKIVEVLAEVGILTSGLVAFQSMDPDVLAAVRRSNIKLDKYDDLGRAFRGAGLGLYTDIIFGLPGSTTVSFRNDLQECLERELWANVHPAQLLVNSPMNDPEYRREHEIVVRPGEIVTSTSTYTRADWDEMMDLRRTFIVGDFFGVLRHVASYTRVETGLREVDFYDGYRRVAREEPERWPVMNLVLESVPDVMVAPASWAELYAEVRDYVVARLSVPDDSALETVLAVQLAMAPDWGRTFPHVTELAHDYASWYADLIDRKVHRRVADWPAAVAPLRSLPPGRLTVEDPAGHCRESLGFSTMATRVSAGWELASAVTRPR